MPKTAAEACHLCSLPTEILLTIFTYLPAKDLTKCRQVCQRWRWIIDGLAYSDILWREYSKRDFPGLYMTARTNSCPGLYWFNIYRSLSLWPRLALANEARDEFACAENLTQEIVGVKVLKNGMLAIHKRQTIMFYDIETLKPARREEIPGSYLKYTETNNTMIFLNYQLHLFIVRKVIHNPCLKPDASFENVKYFLLADEVVYYTTWDDELYIINLEEANLTATLINRSPEGIISLGYTDRLNILTLERNIYSTIKNELVLACTLDADPSRMMRNLKDYNFLDGLDWRLLYQWMFIFRQPIPEGPLRHVITYRQYGDMVFIGTGYGVLQIYHAPNNSFDFLNYEPIRQYNFMERKDCPVLTDSPIIQVDVVEEECGHTVFVAMPKKIAVLKYTHDFRSKSAVAVLPYADMKARVLKIEECA